MDSSTREASRTSAAYIQTFKVATLGFRVEGQEVRMGAIEPTPEQLQGFIEEVEGGVPIVMINLLRYREQADYAQGSGASPCSGREAYRRYAEVAIQKMKPATPPSALAFGYADNPGALEWHNGNYR